MQLEAHLDSLVSSRNWNNYAPCILVEQEPYVHPAQQQIPWYWISFVLLLNYSRTIRPLQDLYNDYIGTVKHPDEPVITVRNHARLT